MKTDLSKVIVAVDFDGTVVEHRYPDIGEECSGALDTLRWLQDQGAQLVLWTMRSGFALEQAVIWLQSRGIRLAGVNRNPSQESWTDSPKVYAHLYIDDAALGCPLKMDSEGIRMCVDWARVREVLEPRFERGAEVEELVNLPAGVEA